MLSKKQIVIGKKLCFLLRHDIINSGLKCDSNGYVNVKELIDKKLIDFIDIDELQYIVENNDKKRFSLMEDNGEYYIKANQGHSLKVGELIMDDHALELITEPYNFCAHGTEEKYIESICENGLNRGLRKHIHCVSEIINKDVSYGLGLSSKNFSNDKQISGFKKKSDRLIIIDMKKCMNDGMLFYKSSNNVILTEGFDGIIDPKYFLLIDYIDSFIK